MPNTKQAKFKAANTGSQQAFTSKTPGASTQPCPLKKQVKIPCDIKDIVIKEHPGSAYDVQVRQEDGSYMSSSTNTNQSQRQQQ